MSNYVAYLCGHLYALALKEFHACLKAEGIPYEVVKEEEQLVHFSSAESPVKGVKRCALTHCLIKLIASGEIIDNQLVIHTHHELPKLSENSTYAARVYRLGKKSFTMPTPELESKIGEYFGLKAKNLNLKVNLKSPDFIIRGLVIKNKVYIGLELWHINRKEYLARDPGKRPVFRPGSMKSEFAKAMVNLSQIKQNELLYDPFCGSGGMLIEGLTLDAFSIGSDIDYEAIQAARANLSALRKDYYMLFISDSRSIPLHEVDAIVTDPPYSIQSSTHGEDVRVLIERFLHEARNVLKDSGRIVLSAPAWSEVDKLVHKSGFEIETCLDVRIHRSLTRRIVVGVKHDT